ncbi:choice-of-anchor C family protein [Streptomyces sp. NPDC049881]|uniref:choice-of-anchor C family protein n=1 Tax=Streptomyces sp. NPDC049881 TaxID=3155778 RepID=UPI00341B352B
MAVKRVLITAVALVGICAVGAGTALAENGVLVSRFDDGSFEYPVARANAFDTYQAGQSIGPWRVTSGAVDLVDDGLWQAAEGNQSLDLNATVPGTVAQTFTTTPGQTYTVTYSLAANTAGGPTVKTGRVLVDGQNVQDFSFDITGKSHGNMGYVRRQVTFVATAATTTLGFASTTANSAYGPVVDDVLVTACPPCPC